MAKETPAWLLRIVNEIQFSIGEHQASEYIESPDLHYVPMTNSHCKHVIFWQDAIIPVIDMNILYDQEASTNIDHLMVVAYQEEDNMPLSHIAFILESPPEKITVSDDDICHELPDSYPVKLNTSLIALFKHNNLTTSVFDMSRLSTTV